MKQTFKCLLGLVWRRFFLALPVLLLAVLVGELLDWVMHLNTPVADLLLSGTGAGQGTRKLLAAGLLLAAVLLLGQVAATGAGRRAGRWLEANVLESMPYYKSLRNLARGLAGEHEGSSFYPARVQIRDGAWAIGFIVAQHANGDYTIFFPTAPSATSGRIEIIRGDQVELLEVTTAQTIGWFMNYGQATGAFLNPDRTRTGQIQSIENIKHRQEPLTNVSRPNLRNHESKEKGHEI